MHPVKVVEELLQGASLIEPVMPVPRFWDTTVTMLPFAPDSVLTLATYLLVEDEDSQPQPFAAGNAGADCMVSVMAVRQVEPARMTSDTFALTV